MRPLAKAKCHDRNQRAGRYKVRQTLFIVLEVRVLHFFFCRFITIQEYIRDSFLDGWPKYFLFVAPGANWTSAFIDKKLSIFNDAMESPFAKRASVSSTALEIFDFFLAY